MILDNLNNKLSAFLNSRLQKQAALGNFLDVKNTDKMAEEAAMTKEMLQLPKYQPIISSLQNATGIINFITNDEYGPLVELLIRSAFPSDTNAIFNAGHPDPDEYFLKPDYFCEKGVPGVVNDVKKARTTLDELLFGTETMLTTKWLKETRKFSNDQVEALLGKPTPSDKMQDPNYTPTIGDRVRQYEAILKAINDKYNPFIEQYNEEIYEHMQKIPAAIQGEDARTLSKETLDKIKSDRDTFIAMKRGEIESLKNSSLAIPVSKVFKGAVRDDDGFISFTPKKDEIQLALLDLVKLALAAQPEAAVLKAASTLRTKLGDFRSTNSHLNKVRDELLKFIGNGTSEDYSRIVRQSRGTLSTLYSQYQGLAHSQQKVLILDDFQKSLLCNKIQSPTGGKTGAGSTDYTLDETSRGAMKDFVDQNAANLERDLTHGKKERGNRTIVVVSSEEIKNLPVSKRVRMEIAPVDAQEAEIIVRHLLQYPSNEVVRAYSRKLHRDVDKEYGASPEKGIAKEKFKEMVSQVSAGIVTEEARQQMISGIIGLGQTDAIHCVREAINKSLKVEDAEVTFDSEFAAKELDKIVDETLSESVSGITPVEKDIEFEDYVTKKTSAWAEKVKEVKDMRDELVRLKQFIKSNEAEIKKINKEIETSNKLPAGHKDKLPPAAIQERMTYVKTMMNQNINAKLDKDSIAATKIPHVYILYGHPGVGKCLGRGTPVIMFDGGVKNVEDIIEGDLLMGPDSKSRTVLNTIYGVGPLYQVDQKNGIPYVCNNAHILSLQDTHKPPDQQSVFISAEDYCKKGILWRHHHKGWKVGIEFPEQDLPIDPYWLGLWLGDGVSRVASIMVGDKDKEIADWLDGWAKNEKMFVRKEKQRGCASWHFTDMQGSDSGCISNHVKTQLRELNLLQNKHIPEIYWKNSSKNRLLLLAGLIDSDGYRCKSGSIQFTNVNKKLARNVLYLARSLGFRTTFSEDIKHLRIRDYKVRAYTVTIGGTLSRIPTKLPRKQGHDNPQKKSLRYGIKVSPIGEGEYFGFTIDGDQQFLLGDFTVTHNSVWSQALASLLNLKIRNVDIGAQKQGLYGSTEQNIARLFKYMKEGRNTVFLIDELDRKVEMGEQQGVNTHEITKEIVDNFLAFFENSENERAFIQNQLFFVITTNNVNAIDTALFQRVGEQFRVELPENPEDYEKFFRVNLTIERRKHPDPPWFYAKGDLTVEDGWNSTMKLINSLDWKKVAVVFAEKETGFRSIKMMFQKAFNAHKHWLISMNDIAEGRRIEPEGMPLTTENLMAIGSIIDARNVGEDEEVRNDKYMLGVDAITAEKSEATRKILEPYILGQKKLETTKRQIPFSDKEETVFRLPDEVNKILDGTATTAGEVPVEGEEDQWEYKKETMPDGTVKTIPRKKKVKTPEEKMQDLTDKGFKEQPIIEQPQEIQPKEDKKQLQKPKDTKKKEPVPEIAQLPKEPEMTSSTDYLFNYLIKKGLVEGETVSAKRIKLPEKSADERGVYVFNRGLIMIAPRSANVAPQQIETEMAKLNKANKVDKTKGKI